MDSGCEGCAISPRGQHEALSNIRTIAKKYAIENEKTVAIYKEGFEYRYCDAEVAINSAYAVIEMLSKHN